MCTDKKCNFHFDERCLFDEFALLISSGATNIASSKRPAVNFNASILAEIGPYSASCRERVNCTHRRAAAAAATVDAPDVYNAGNMF